MNILVFSEGKMYKINNKNMKEGTEDITIIASSPYKYDMTYREIDIMAEENIKWQSILLMAST